MSLYVPSEPSRFLSALGQMIHDQCPPRIDLFWVTGLAETLDLIEAENEAVQGTHDLWPEDIERVSVAWGDFESESWNGGFVVLLHDGRMKYIESRADGLDWGPDSSASVVAMEQGQDFPELPRYHQSNLYGWVGTRPELEEFLALALNQAKVLH
jgi:hypothetical protein